MTKVEFANICNGSEVQRYDGTVYRLRERICRKLVVQKVSHVASAPLVEIIAPPQHADWKLLRRA